MRTEYTTAKICNFVTKRAKILDKSRERESIMGTVSVINKIRKVPPQ